MDPKSRKGIIIFGIVLLAVLVIVAAILIVRLIPGSGDNGEKGAPFNIAVTFGDDPRTQKNFSWYTEEGIDGSVVQYYAAGSADADDAFDAGKALTAEGFTDQFETGYPRKGEENSASGKLEKVTYNRHGVYVDGLTPGTLYVYRVGNGRYWSSPATFTTAPDRYIDGSEGFSFLVVSDMQGFVRSDYELWGTVFNKALSKCSDPAFMVNIGDLTENRDNAITWRYYFSLARGSENLTTVPVEGNKDDEMFLKYFLLGTREGVTGLNGYYSFDYMNVHFTVVNTGDGTKDLTKSQLKWLKSDLSSSKAQNALYRIVLIHKAPYSDRNHADDSEIRDIRAQVLPVFEEYSVDVVIEGHDHYYFRSEPVVNNGSEAADYTLSTESFSGEEYKIYSFTGGNSGVFYFMPGASGVKQHSKSFREMPEILASQSVIVDNPTFCVCDVTADRILFRTYKVDRYSNTVTLTECWGIGK